MKKILVVSILLPCTIFGMHKNSRQTLFVAPTYEMQTVQHYEKPLYVQGSLEFVKVAFVGYSLYSRNNKASHGSLDSFWQLFWYSDTDALKLLVAKTILEMKKSGSNAIFVKKYGHLHTALYNPLRICEELGFEDNDPTSISLFCTKDKIAHLKQVEEAIENRFDQIVKNVAREQQKFQHCRRQSQ